MSNQSKTIETSRAVASEADTSGVRLGDSQLEEIVAGIEEAPPPNQSYQQQQKQKSAS